MSFERDVVRIQKKAGWSDLTLLGLFMDYFWTTKRGKTVGADVVKHLTAIKNRCPAPKKAVEGDSNERGR